MPPIASSDMDEPIGGEPISWAGHRRGRLPSRVGGSIATAVLILGAVVVGGQIPCRLELAREGLTRYRGGVAEGDTLASLETSLPGCAQIDVRGDESGPDPRIIDISWGRGGRSSPVVVLVGPDRFVGRGRLPILASAPAGRLTASSSGNCSTAGLCLVFVFDGSDPGDECVPAEVAVGSVPGFACSGQVPPVIDPGVRKERTPDVDPDAPTPTT